MKSLDQTLCIHNKFSQLPCIAYDITISFQEVESENSRQGVRSKMEMSSSVDRYLHIPYRNKIFSTSSPPPFPGTRNSIGGSWNITSYILEWHRLNFCSSTQIYFYFHFLSQIIIPFAPWTILRFMVLEMIESLVAAFFHQISFNSSHITRIRAEIWSKRIKTQLEALFSSHPLPDDSNSQSGNCKIFVKWLSNYH